MIESGVSRIGNNLFFFAAQSFRFMLDGFFKRQRLSANAHHVIVMGISAVHRITKQCNQFYIWQNLRDAIRRGGMKNIIRSRFAGNHAGLHLEARREVSAIPAKSFRIMYIEEFDFFAKRRIDLRMPRQIIEEGSCAAFHYADHKKIRQDAQRRCSYDERATKKTGADSFSTCTIDWRYREYRVPIPSLLGFRFTNHDQWILSVLAEEMRETIFEPEHKTQKWLASPTWIDNGFEKHRAETAPREDFKINIMQLLFQPARRQLLDERAFLFIFGLPILLSLAKTSASEKSNQTNEWSRDQHQAGIIPAIDDCRSSIRFENTVQFKICAAMFAQWQMMNRVHRNNAVKRVRFEWKVGNIRDNVQTFRTESLSALPSMQ